MGKLGEPDSALSVVTIVELTRGIYRAKSDTDCERRRAFSEELRRNMVLPVTVEIAELAGRIEGEQASRGISIAFEDLLIGTTALHIGYAVVTINVRHFQAIPGTYCLATLDPTEGSVLQNLTQVNDSARKIRVMLTAASHAPRPCDQLLPR